VYGRRVLQALAGMTCISNVARRTPAYSGQQTQAFAPRTFTSCRINARPLGRQALRHASAAPQQKQRDRHGTADRRARHDQPTIHRRNEPRQAVGRNHLDRLGNDACERHRNHDERAGLHATRKQRMRHPRTEGRNAAQRECEHHGGDEQVDWVSEPVRGCDQRGEVTINPPRIGPAMT